MTNKATETKVNKVAEAIRKSFVIGNEAIVNGIAGALVATKEADDADANKSLAYQAIAGAMDDDFGKNWLDVTFQAVKTGVKDLAAGYAKIAGTADLTVNQVKELHQINLAMACEAVGGNRQVWQNVKLWSKHATGPKAKHPDVKKAQEEAKVEAEKNETPDDAVIKVLNVIKSQYQYLGKIEEANQWVECLMLDLVDVLKKHGVDIETL